MRRFRSHLIGCFLIIGLVLGCHNSWGDDIEIDLGSNATPAPKKTEIAVFTPTPKLPVPQKAENPGENNPVDKDSSVSSGSVINRIEVSSEETGAKVSIEGTGLPKPFVDKSEKKVLLKFSKTKLKIPPKIKEKNEIVKGIRSSLHPGVAWIVLDVTNSEGLNIEKSDSGYFLEFQNPLSSVKPSGSNPPSADSETLSNKPSSPKSEKGIFSRLIDVSLKPVGNDLKQIGRASC